MVKMHCVGAFGMVIRSGFRLHLPRSIKHKVMQTLTDWCQAKLQGLGGPNTVRYNSAYGDGNHS